MWVSQFLILSRPSAMMIMKLLFVEKINYYLIAGYVFDLSYDLKFKPALLTKLIDGAPLQVDQNFMYNDKFTLWTSL
jgi:hypothetical protein